MLMGIMVLSLIVPLLHFTTTHPTVINEEVYLMQNLIEEKPIPVFITPTTASPHITWMQVLTAIYFIGVAIMLLLTLLQAIMLIRFMHSGVHHTDNKGNTVILHNNSKISPFSIFRFIVMNVKDYENCRQYVLTHEQEHIRLGHTYDLLLLEAMKTLQWFNPFIWFLSRDLKTIHEYEADQAVINQGIDAKSYQQLLVMKVVGNRLQPFTNNLNHGSLKKRIFMMYQKPSNRWLMLKAFCAIPVVALTLNAFATPTETNPVEDIVSTLENKEIPIFNEPKAQVPTTEEVPAEAVNPTTADDNAPFTIHPVRDQFGRITGFSHEGKPADCDKDFDCTYEYIFINDRPATEEEVRNYQSLDLTLFALLKKPEGTAKYNYKDKKGIICFTIENNEPLLVVNGNIVNIPITFDIANASSEQIAALIKADEEDIKSITVLKDAAAKAIYGEKGKNGVIEIKTQTPIDSLVQRLPGVERHPDGHLTIQGKNVKKVLVEGEEVYNEDHDELFEICEEPAQYVGGNAALHRFIAQNIRYPKIAQENGITGLVIVQFIVNKDGTCKDFQIVRNTAHNMDGVTITALAQQTQGKKEVTHSPEELLEMKKSLEEEALRVCRLMGKWQPAKQRGKIVRMKMNIPFTFRLQ